MKHWVLIVFVLLIGCTDINLSGDTELETEGVEIAIPLFHSELTIPAISEVSDVDGNVEILQDGTVQVNYAGDVLRQTSLEIFPPFPGLLDIDILDTLYSIPLPIEGGDRIEKSTIGKTSIDFFFNTLLQDEITINLYLPQLSKDGNIFNTQFNIDNRQGDSPSLRSGEFLIEDYTFIPEGNSLLFRYDARSSNGQRIKLDQVKMGFDIFIFKYVEGKFGPRTFDVRGDIITIDIFNNWVSGGISFLDPKVTLEVENAFGLETKSKFNRMDIITVDGKTLQLESILLDEGIEFGFPGFDEIGASIFTSVEFNSGNSNIKELFEQKASKVSYDIDALINSGDPEVKGFLTDSSFFDIKVEVNLPIEGTVNDLVVEETSDVDLSEYDDIKELELKFNISNTYPMDMTMQVYFQDDGGNTLDSLFLDELLYIEGAPLDDNGIVIEGSSTQALAKINSSRVKPLLVTKKIKMRGRFDTGKYGKTVRLLDSYSVDLDVGAKIKIE